MLLHIPDVLTSEQVADARRRLDDADWVDGRVTAGHQSARVKHNMQLAENHPVAEEIGDVILTALQRNPLFVAAALPLRVFPPLFNRYEGGQSFGNHVDNAIRQNSATGQRIRTDLSATLFLSAPHEYEGGELLVEDTYGVHSVKLPAGHLILYPSTSLHNVQPVTSGARLAAFFWIQSLVRQDADRTLLFDLDTAVQRLNQDAPDHPSTVQLTAVYHNLLRRWAEISTTTSRAGAPPLEVNTGGGGAPVHRPSPPPSPARSLLVAVAAARRRLRSHCTVDAADHARMVRAVEVASGPDPARRTRRAWRQRTEINRSIVHDDVMDDCVVVLEDDLFAARCRDRVGDVRLVAVRPHD